MALCNPELHARNDDDDASPNVVDMHPADTLLA